MEKNERGKKTIARKRTTKQFSARCFCFIFLLAACVVVLEVFFVKKLLKCSVCSEYTLKNVHCEKRTASAHPPKYSPIDKWAKYRRLEKFGKE